MRLCEVLFPTFCHRPALGSQAPGAAGPPTARSVLPGLLPFSAPPASPCSARVLGALLWLSSLSPVSSGSSSGNSQPQGPRSTSCANVARPFRGSRGRLHTQ